MTTFIKNYKRQMTALVMLCSLACPALNISNAHAHSAVKIEASPAPESASSLAVETKLSSDLRARTRRSSRKQRVESGDEMVRVIVQFDERAGGGAEREVSACAVACVNLSRASGRKSPTFR